MKISLILLTTFCALCLVVLAPSPIDDAYITFRYSTNLWNAGELVYNRGEWVLGTTTILWSLILAAFYGVGTSLEFTARLIGCVAWGVVTFTFVSTIGGKGRSFSSIHVLWIIALGTYFPIFLSVGSGMETLPYIFSVSTALFLSSSRRSPLGAAIATAAAMWLRPDGVLCAIICAINFARSPRSLMCFGGMTAVAGGAYAVFSLSLFGEFLPHSIVAKKVLYPVPWDKGFLMVLEGFQQSPLDALLFCAGAAGFIVRREDAFTRSVGLWAILYVVSLGLSGVKPIFFWYFVPVWFAILSVGLAGLLKVRRGHVVVGGVLCVTIASSLFEMQKPQAAYEREEIYRQIVGHYQSQMTPTDRVLVGETGILGYGFLSSYVCDSAGIVSPEITNVIRDARASIGGNQGQYGDISGFAGWTRRAIEACEANWIIGPRGRMGLLEAESESWFMSAFERIDLYRDDGVAGIGVYRRRDVARRF